MSKTSKTSQIPHPGNWKLFLSGIILYGLAYFVSLTSPYYERLLAGPKVDFSTLQPIFRAPLDFLFDTVGRTPSEILRSFFWVYIAISVWKYLISYRTTPAPINRPYRFWLAWKKIFTNNRLVFSSTRVQMPKEAGITREDLTALLYFAVKFFFLPLMVTFFCQNVSGLVHDANLIPKLLYSTGEAQKQWYYTAVDFILFFDVTFFMIGYLCEFKGKSELRSVEPTAFGWMVTLACYPPFNSVVGGYLPWGIPSINNYGSISATTFFLALAATCYAIYGFASIALNLKASNLTNRGIVAWGPYSIIRHPAYAAKNLAWIILSLPALVTGNLGAIFTVFVWCGIYYLRAITEERHLLQDPDYVAYCEKVKYRFIPGVY